MPPIITPALNSAGTLQPGFMTTSGASSLDETHRVDESARHDALTRLDKLPRANPLSISALGGKQLPVPLGDDFDGAVGHLDGGLIVNCVHRHRQPRSPFFCVRQGIVRDDPRDPGAESSKVNQSRSMSRDEIPLISPLGVANTMCSDVSAFPLPLGRFGRSLRRWRPSPCFRRSLPRRPTYAAATAGGLPIRTAASSGQIEGIAAPNQQGVRLLDGWDPSFLSILGSAVSSSTPRDFQPNSDKGDVGLSADRLPRHAQHRHGKG